MGKIKFSVLMSVYKKENPVYFKQAINSVINQTLKPSQIVIVCDGTLTKELYDVINYFQEAYPHLFEIIKYSENKGLGKALNIGLKKCKYDYVARMDTDDISREDRFEKQFAYLLQNDDIAILGSNIAEFDSDINHINSYRIVPSNPAEIEKFAHKRNPFNHMTVILKKEAVINVGSYMDMPLAEDYYLWARMLNKGYKGANINDNLVYARTGDNMIARRSGLQYAKNIYHLRYTLYKIGFINFYEFTLFSIGHCIIAILPLAIKRNIYNSILHKTSLKKVKQ